MTYSEVVEELRKHYPVLWFWPGTQNYVDDTGEPENWSHASIISPGGRYLAYQVGNANQWELADNYLPPDLPALNPSPDDCGELTVKQELKAKMGIIFLLQLDG
ncbi:hypothetical protein ZW56_002004 [Salmonella enterica subsp. enterica]|nr:hypothetical protein [Salmonella enterica subsp. enterica]EDV2939571.1 hypothetical protein [Salmonella enterica subsp. enterica]EEJ3480228.1 hypothetical protein [Salmonella enterica subsp. enterica]